jgi:TolB protein
MASAALLAAAALTLAVTGAASAAAPDGPRLALTVWRAKPARLALLTVEPSGAGRQKVVEGGLGGRVGPSPFGGPSWSPDGSLMAFSGQSRKVKTRIFLIAADGSNLREVPGTRGALNPVFSADGRMLAFARSRLYEPPFDPKHPLESILRDGFFGTTTWLLDLATGQQRRLFRWRDGLHVEPSSFSPDGSVLALSRSSRRGSEAIALRLADGKVTVLARNAEEPVYSPDGSRIAFVSYRDRNVTEGFGEPVLASELYVRSAAGGRPQRLTRTHDWQEASPSWDPSGERLAYTQSTSPEPIALGFTNVIRQINADGTCRRIVFGKRRSNGAGLYGPAWQPGPGREAGRIPC